MEFEQLKRGPQDSGSQQPGAKRTRQSCVLHIATLPEGVTEQELLQLCSPFGTVAKHIILRRQHQALVEMADIDAARQAVHYFSTVMPVLRGVALHVQFSNHESLNVSDGDGGDRPRRAAGEANNILLATISNVIYPLTVDVVYQVFHKFGEILRIVVFSRNGQIQTLVEFSSIDSASAARTELNDQNIYSGCCTLDIIFSNLKAITVRFNSDLSRDFTNPSLPSTPSTGGLLTGMPQPPRPGMRPAGVGGSSSSPPPGAPMRNSLGMDQPQGAPHHGMPPTMSQGGQVPHPALMHAGYAGYTGYGAMYGAPPGAAAGQMVPGAPVARSGRVCMVGNLDVAVTPDMVFTLLGVYGDVVKVKILYNKRDVGLVEFAEEIHCQRAIRYLNNVPFFGKSLALKPSPHPEIIVRREDNAELTKTYGQSPLHRFRYPDSKNEKHICAPSAVLHIANLDEAMRDDELHSLFMQFGQVVALKRFSMSKKMALVEMDSIATAVAALVGMHDKAPPGDLYKNLMRVSFSAGQIRDQAAPSSAAASGPASAPSSTMPSPATVDLAVPADPAAPTAGGNDSATAAAAAAVAAAAVAQPQGEGGGGALLPPS